MSATRHLWPAVLAVVIALVPAAAGAGHDPGRTGEVSRAEDDPPGCETATSEDDDGCGARGRDHFADPDHEPPIEACADRTSPAGGRITRILPDGPRRPDGSLAFQSGACVYLPPGYASAGLRYPVVYVLHGGGGDQSNWVTNGEIELILDRVHAADPDQAVIAVMPDGRSGQWYDYEDGSYRFESYVLEHLVPYVDEHYRTIADRSGRAIAGLSNGGYGSVHFAAKRPDLFVVAGGMSSNLGARALTGLGESGAVHYQGSVPFQLASNLDEIDVILDIGTSCRSDVTTDACASIAIDLAFWPDHIAFAQRMDDVDHRGDFDYRETEGSHAWRWWSKWFEERDLPFFFERMDRPRAVATPATSSPAPASFRYRSIAPSFGVWDHVVRVERDVREFLDLRDVTTSGFEIQGSGLATLTTAPRHRPGDVYAVTGTDDDGSARRVVADTDGRLSIAVDLGPSHEHDQFSDEADVAEAAGDYWVVRTVSFTPTGERAAPPPAPDLDTSPDRVPRRAATGFGPLAGAVGGLGTAITDDAGSGGSGSAPTLSEVGANVPPAAAPRAVAFERGPQLVPTVAFLVALIGGGAWWWRRRNRATDGQMA